MHAQVVVLMMHKWQDAARKASGKQCLGGECSQANWRASGREGSSYPTTPTKSLPSLMAFYDMHNPPPSRLISVGGEARKHPPTRNPHAQGLGMTSSPPFRPCMATLSERIPFAMQHSERAKPHTLFFLSHTLALQPPHMPRSRPANSAPCRGPL